VFQCLEVAGKSVTPDPDDSATDRVEADPRGDVGDDELATSEYVAPCCSYPPGIKGVPSRWNLGRAVKQKIDYEDLNAELNKLLAQEVEKISCNSDKSNNRGQGHCQRLAAPVLNFPQSYGHLNFLPSTMNHH
jgi:hypothetical protein